MIRLWNSVALCLATLVVLSSIGLWWQAYRRLKAREPLIPFEPGDSRPWGLLDVLVAIVFQFGTAAIAGEWLRETHNLDLARPLEQLNSDERVLYMAATAASSFAAFLATLVWLLIRYRCSAEELGIQWRRFAADIRLGLAAFVMLAPVVYTIQFLLVRIVESKHPLIQLLKADSNLRLLALSAFAAVIVAPFGEEFFFRLLLQSWLDRLAGGKDRPWQVLLGGRSFISAPAARGQAAESRGHSPTVDIAGLNPYHSPSVETMTREAEPGQASRQWAPIFGSSLLFALVHVSHGPDSIPLFMFGLGLGYLYSRTHRILPSIVVHFLLNLTTIAALCLALVQEVES